MVIAALGVQLKNLDAGFNEQNGQQYHDENGYLGGDRARAAAKHRV